LKVKRNIGCCGNILGNDKRFIEKEFKRKASFYFRKAEEKRGYHD